MPGNPVSSTHWQTPDGAVLPYVVDPAGKVRILAALPKRRRLGGPRRLADVAQVIPRSQWQEVDMSGYACPVLDQGETSSCTGHGTATAFTRAWLKAGHALRRFSPCYVYGQVNGGRDQGAYVADTATELTTKGICLESTVPEGMIYTRQFPSDADAEAARFKAGDVLACNTFDELGTAILLEYPVVFGIMVGQAFVMGQLDAEGVAPRGTEAGGHCLAGHGLVMTRGSGWTVPTQNSWSTAWGMGGFCLLSEASFVDGQEAGLDAYAIRVVRDDPQDPGNPPQVS